MQLLAGAGDAAFAIDRLENDEEIQIDPREITHVDGSSFLIFISMMSHAGLASPEAIGGATWISSIRRR
jgi:hypothetical protein